mgnify:CR=1 FL=1
MSERFFTSEKKYYSIESVGEQFKAVKAYKLIEKSGTTQSEESKVFDSVESAFAWVNEE